MNINIEYWVICPIPYNKYEASNYGNIRNIKTKKNKVYQIDKNGYYKTNIYNTNNTQTKILVHRLIAFTYIDSNIYNELTVDHIDRNKQNNNIDNLRFATRIEQNNNRTIGIRQSGYSKQKIIQYDLNYIFIKEWENMYQITKILNINKKLISRVCLNQRKSTKGFIFKYKQIDDYENEIWEELNCNNIIINISSFGRIKKKDKIIQPSNLNGYLRVKINKKSFMVHRLVALVFINNPDNKLIVNHKDLNKNNNNVYNLEWSTHSENTQHYFSITKNQCKQVLQFDSNNNLINTYYSLKEAANSININYPQNLSKKIKDGKLYHGFYWKFYNNLE